MRRAHRVHILSRMDDTRNAHFRSAVQDGISKYDSTIRVHEHPLDAKREFEDALLQISRLILREARGGHRILVNMSAGSKISGTAAMYAALYHRSRVSEVYYARPSRYFVDSARDDATFFAHGLSEGPHQLVEMPTLATVPPTPTVARALTILYNNPGMRLLELGKALKKAGLEPFTHLPNGELDRKETTRWRNKVRRIFSARGTVPGLVSYSEPDAERRVRLYLTKPGEHQALLTGYVEQLRAESKP